jgi:SAM-dependent methyltransferase
MNQNVNKKVVDANVEVHSRLAKDYRKSEPHYRDENIEKVEARIDAIIGGSKIDRALDLGCGTGFMIDILRSRVGEVVGVDVTQEMLNEVDLDIEGAKVRLVNNDTGSYEPGEGSFQLVTAYSFLHHLSDLIPTFETAFKALSDGGTFYADLEPNFYFWEAISEVSKGGSYDPVVQREISALLTKGAEIEEQYGVAEDVFHHAEYGKDVTGGFKETSIVQSLKNVGFSKVECFYHWFIGEGHLINRDSVEKNVSLRDAKLVTECLERALPLSRNLFKYMGFVATK